MPPRFVMFCADGSVIEDDGDDVEVTIVDVRGDKVRLGITAPREISVHRREVYEAIQREKESGGKK